MQSRYEQITKAYFLGSAKAGDMYVVLSYIQENKGNPSAINVIDNDGRSALMLAAKAGNYESINVIKTLLTVPDVNVNIIDKFGHSALSWLCSSNHECLSTLLAFRDINLEVTGPEGNTPLMRAAENGDGESVLKLLEAGANVNAVNKRSDTALVLAAENGRRGVVNLLLLEKSLKIDLHNQGRRALLAAEKIEKEKSLLIFNDLKKHMTSLQLAATSAERTASLLVNEHVRFFSPLQQQNNLTPAVTQLNVLPKP